MNDDDPGQEAENLFRPRHISEWHEDIGPVLWWTNPITESPYAGSPLDLGHTVQVDLRSSCHVTKSMTTDIGGWPGYHEWWTPLPDGARIAANLPAPDLSGRKQEEQP